MKILEIIQLRSARDPIEGLSNQIDESIGADADQAEAFTIYHRDGLDTDLAVHIHRREESRGGGPSRLGLRLASELRVFGLVEHTVWEELQ